MSGPHWLGRSGHLIALLASLLVCSTGLAQFENCPNPKGGDCFKATPGIPGCQLQSCCETVCRMDPICCVVEWDQICANIAIANCTFCGPGNGDCSIPNGTPGCDDVACCEAVCKIDPPCCEQEWDAICVQEAKDICSCNPGDAPANDDCANAIGISEGDTPFTTLCATPDGPEHPGLPCGQILFPDLGRDVWFRYTATFTGTVRAQTCGDADYDTELAVYDSCACPVDPDTILGCDAAGQNCLGFGSEVIFDVELDHCYTIRVGGVGTASGTGILSVGEDMPPKAPPNDDCANALVLMLDQPTLFDNSTASTDGFPSVICSFFGQADIKKDLWYDFTPNTDGTFQVSLCGSSFDTKLAVYEECACPAPGNPIVCNDDFCDAQSRVSFTGVAGQCYKIRVGSFPGDPGGPGQIELIQTAGSCVLETAGANYVEAEICGDDTNGGCNSDPAAFESISSGDIIHGTAWADGGMRDTDWYSLGDLASFDTNGNGQVDIHNNIVGELPMVSFIVIDALGDCSDLSGAGTSSSEACSQTNFNVSTVNTTDILYVFAGTGQSDGTGIFDGFPCSEGAGNVGNNYLLCVTVVDDGDPVDPICEAPGAPCPADLVVDGAVDVKDLLFLLGAWGPCPPKGDCPADLVVDGAVDVKDLLFLLGAWGPCR